MAEPRTELGHAALKKVLKGILRREPSIDEFKTFEDVVAAGATLVDIVDAVGAYAAAEKAVVRPQDEKSGIGAFDADYLRQARRKAVTFGVPDVNFDLERMTEFWIGNVVNLQQAFRFIKSKKRPLGPYSETDAAMICAKAIGGEARNILEIGAGHAVSVIAEICSELGHNNIRYQCFGAKAGRLRGVRAGDGPVSLIDVFPGAIQSKGLDSFLALNAGDIILIDTSHVLAPASDLHHILFHILPVLKQGVIVFFHNCRYPLEYTPGILETNRGNWNEVYAIRLLLSNSSRYTVKFSGSYFAAHFSSNDVEELTEFFDSPGNGIWLEVENQPSVHSEDYWTPLVSSNRKVDSINHPASPGTGERQLMVEFDNQGIGKIDLKAREQLVNFQIWNRKDSEIFVSLGVRKSGSTLLHKIVRFLARANKINAVDIPGTFFSKGLGVADWSKLPLEQLLYPGNVFLGFRSFPSLLANSDKFRQCKKVFMHRDPRDAIVSQYFSDAFSHKLPEENIAGGKDQFIAKREKAQASSIDSWVVENAPGFARTLGMFKPMLDDPNCLIVPYERYVLEKSDLIQQILAHFCWALPESDLELLLQSIDIVPTSENPSKFIRKAVPGDHKSKLTPQTIETLDEIFSEVKSLFKY